MVCIHSGRLEHTRQFLRTVVPRRVSRLQALNRGRFIKELRYMVRYTMRYMVHVGCFFSYVCVGLSGKGDQDVSGLTA